MKNKIVLPPAVSKYIDSQVDELFNRIMTRLLGHGFTGKSIYITYDPESTIPGIFEEAVTSEGGVVDTHILDQLAVLARDYLNKHKEQAKIDTKMTISVLFDDLKNGKIQPEDFPEQVEDTMFDLWEKVSRGVQSVVVSESEHAKTVGIKEGIDQINTSMGIDDPVVAFIPRIDQYTCHECITVHMMPDEKTPKVWRSSEVEVNYHKREDLHPSWSLLHPHCRCFLVSVLPGFGFGDDGRVTWIGSGFSELDFQRSGKFSPSEAARVKFLKG